MSEQEKQYIPIYYGDDTDFHNRVFVTVTINTTMDLSGMTATLYLGQLKKDYTITNGAFEIKLSSNETKTLPLGELEGRISLFDSTNRRRTISSEVPFFVSKKVTTWAPISITLDVDEDSGVAYVTTQMKAEQLAQEAQTAATNAASSASAAATSATNAANSASAAASSATAAGTAKTGAETAESNASTHATNASNSASAASQSATDAANSASQAASTLESAVHKTGNETVAGNKDFTGTLTAVTPNAGDNSQKVATTAFVNSAIANAPVDGGVANNGYYEEKDLGTWESVADVEAFLSTHKVSTGKFGSLKLGNYVTIKDGTYNKKWAIAGFDVHLSVGDTALNTHHIALFPKNNLLSARMNETNTTAGGYAGSEMHTVTIPAVVENLQTVLGAHLLKHRRLLSNSVATSAASGAGAGWTGSSNAWAWTDVYACLLTEPQLYGTRAFSSGAYDVGEGAYQLPLFRFISHVKYSREWFWLRAVASTTGFCGASNYGGANYSGASNSFGVRPLILIG